MKLILLGTGGLIPTDTAQTACFMLPEQGILLDAGTGLYRMHAYLQTSELDVYLTHEHGDHTSGLIYLFASCLVNEINRSECGKDGVGIGEAVRKANQFLHSTRIHATQSALDFLMKEYEPYQMDWRCLEAREPLPGGGWLTSFKVKKGAGDEVGFRLDWPGHSLAYVTDTFAEPDAPYIDAIRGVDLLLHDGNGPNRLAGLMQGIHHSHVAGAAQVAALAGVGRLILIHHNPIEQWSTAADVEAARAIFPFTETGVDGMEVDF